MALALVVTLGSAWQTRVNAQEKGQADPPNKPITTDQGMVGKLLREWWSEGTASGNMGDFYDNRDGGHSDLRMSPYPQLQRIPYSPEDIKKRRHWAAQRRVLPQVVFGNSSTSAPLLLGGSNIRHLYTFPAGLELLYRQYRGNNLYIYPEHRDHDVGHNGEGGGYGDVYPTNTPYLIASQGSSGSDRPFMRAIPFTLAAFRPEVKEKLAATGLLTPTIQMILRITNNHLTGPKEYLSGKAHPTVFEGRWVDTLKMVKLAHAITSDDIPPMVQLKVVEEDVPIPDVDYFEPGRSERLGDTPAAIARIVRSRRDRRRMVISAEESFDMNKRPLKYHWVVLRGDQQRIKIVPRNTSRSVVEIVVPYHGRRPVTAGSKLESNRVDIGVFVHNGKYYSAPAFVTFFSLDHESRTYDKNGRLIEIGYGMGQSLVTVADWPRLLEVAASDSPSGRLLQLEQAQRDVLLKAVPQYKSLQGAVAAAREQSRQATAQRGVAAKNRKAAALEQDAAAKSHAAKPTAESKKRLDKANALLAAADAARKKADEEARNARKRVLVATGRLDDLLDAQQPPLRASIRALLRARIDNLIEDPNFVNMHAKTLQPRMEEADKSIQAVINLVHRKLVDLSIIDKNEGFSQRLELTPIREGATPPAQRLTAFERSALRHFNAVVLTNLLYPKILMASYRTNYVDPRISPPKHWRDVYQHDSQGHCTGWMRYQLRRPPVRYNAQGMIVLEIDELGRCTKARTVKYVPDPAAKGPRSWPPTVVQPGDEVVTYEYKDTSDGTGKIKSRTRIKGSGP